MSLLFSCENEKVKNKLTDFNEVLKQSSMFDYIEFMNIQSAVIGCENNKLCSVHKQEQVLTVIKDFYDMPIN